MSSKGQVPGPGERRLDSWKSIAEYLGRDVRSVQRWEAERGLPVHRVPGTRGGGVFAYVSELEDWLRQPTRDNQDVSAGPQANSSAPPSASPHTQPSSDREPAQDPASASWTGRRLALSALALVLVLGVGLLVVARRRPAVKPAPQRLMLAVLPFTNLSGDPAQDYFTDGLTEEMITDLGRLNPQVLGVIARTSSMKYKHTNEDVSQIGRELGVSYVLEGSVRREGNVARISAQLIQVSDQTHLWAQNYQRDVNDILAVQRDVAQSIADRIQVGLSPGRAAEVAEESPAAPAAYDDYLKGLYFCNQRDVKSLSEGADFFARPSKLTPITPPLMPAWHAATPCWAWTVLLNRAR